MEKKFLSLDKNMMKKISIGVAVVAIGAFALYKVNIFGTTEVKVAKVEVDVYKRQGLFLQLMY